MPVVASVFGPAQAGLSLTSEMGLEKIETVLVDQSIVGRMLDFGTVVIRGTGGGLEPVPYIAHPLDFRSKLTAP